MGPSSESPTDHIYPTVGTAVSAYVRASGEPWTDWEEDARVDDAARYRAARTAAMIAGRTVCRSPITA